MAIYVALMNGRGIFAFDADDAEVHSFDQILCAEYEGGSGIYFRKAFAVEEEKWAASLAAHRAAQPQEGKAYRWVVRLDQPPEIGGEEIRWTIYHMAGLDPHGDNSGGRNS
jgi:hypothetical protein